MPGQSARDAPSRAMLPGVQVARKIWREGWGRVILPGLVSISAIQQVGSLFSLRVERLCKGASGLSSYHFGLILEHRRRCRLTHVR
jgi:hypothetical protein